jgi:hypothetical protein
MGSPEWELPLKHEHFATRQVSVPARSKRVGVVLICDVRQGTRPWKKARLEDLSREGFRIANFPDARAEIPLRVRIPGLQMLSARICWQRGGAVGCQFSEPLHVAVFEHIARTATAA